VLFGFSVVSFAVVLQCWGLLRRCRAVEDSASAHDRRFLQESHETMEKRLALLGTIANAAPFVGLLGTVIGIIRAFHSISTSTGNGGLALVAGGISEALISTAAGLAVAIPASMLYNFFTYHVEKLAKDARLE
jgi:biopolymer transport protein ExbB/TolQ